MDQTTPFVHITDLTYQRDHHVIFDHIALRVPSGKITAILGPSGTGKTTLLKLIGGMLIPDQGQILIQGHNIHQLSRHDRQKRRRHMGMLFQNGALFTHMTIFDNVAFPLREHTKLTKHMIADLVYLKLQAVGLRGTAHFMPGQLSGGMARRVALARTIALDPELVLYDEPFTGQDPISMGVLIKLIKQLNDAFNMTSIIVSHDVTETLGIADYAYILSGGHIVGEGTPQQLTQSDNPFVIQFMQGLPDGAVPFHYPAKSLSDQLWQEL